MAARDIPYSLEAKMNNGRQLLTLPERSEEHTSELQSPCNLVCRLLLEKKKKIIYKHRPDASLYFISSIDELSIMWLCATSVTDIGFVGRHIYRTSSNNTVTVTGAYCVV